MKDEMDMSSKLRQELADALIPSLPSLPENVVDGGAYGDFDLNHNVPEGVRQKPLKPAAVLVPIITYEDMPRVLFTRRAEHLSNHSGQIAFPGGRLDQTDPTVQAAALREAHEEIGLSPERVDVLGYADSYETFTGYYVVPVIGLIAPGFEMQINPDEVSDVFEVPLQHLMNQQNHIVESAQFKGRQRYFYAIPYEQHYIWGATAGMIRAISERAFR